MKDAVQLWQWPEGTGRGEVVGIFDTVEAAIDASHVDRSEWVFSPNARFYVPLADGDRTGRYQSWLVSPVRVPETDADRIELALDLALDNGQTGGDHQKLWVIDQIVRVLAGDRYEQIVTDYCDGEDGPETYEWDTGIAP